MHSAWRTAKLGGVARVLASNVDKHIHQDEIPVKLCNYLDVYRNRRLLKPYEFSPGSVTQSEADRFTINKGDVLITKDSETPDDIGVPCLIADEFENTVCGYHLALIRPGEGLNSGFLSHLFQSEATRRYFLAKAAGLTRFGLNARTIGGLPIPLPQPDEQTAIAGVLDAVERAMLNVRGVIAKAERLQKGLMQQWLTGRLKPDGTPRAASDFKSDEHFGKLPRLWESARVKSLIAGCEYGLSRAMSEQGQYPIFRMNNIERGRMVASPLAYIDLSPEDFARYRISKGDILFNRTNTVELVGKVGFFALEGDFVFASYLVRLVANQENDARFLNYYLNSFEGQKRIAAKVTPSIGQANINTHSLKSVWAIKPPREEQSAIADRLDAFFDLIRAKEEKIAALQRLKKSLMQNLLTGRVRLPAAVAAKKEATR
jgi:type I restriction enzyme S subunit